jgi:hypothetical protein
VRAGRNPGNWATRSRYAATVIPMSEANPDPSGSTGEFRAFVEGAGAEPVRRGGLRNPVAAAIIVVAIIAVIAVIVVAVH